MDFLDHIFERFRQDGKSAVLGEVRPQEIFTITGEELLALVDKARQFLRTQKLRAGERCGVLAPNSIQWVSLDLALLAEGIITVPLYYRQAPAELASMIHDSGAVHICCGDEKLRDAIREAMPGAPACFLLSDAFKAELSTQFKAAETEKFAASQSRSDSTVTTIIYTSGTSGEPKGVPLTVGNLNHMLSCTAQKLDKLMAGSAGPDRIYHFLPFSFAGSWILLLSGLSRKSLLLLSTDLNKIPEEIGMAQPHYFLNVPTLLERMRRRVEETMAQRGGIIGRVFASAKRAALSTGSRRPTIFEGGSLVLAQWFIFPRIRHMLGRPLRALICGSAPLAIETQRFFQMLGISVLQVYGLTETTAICTMDEPGREEAGCVGQAVPGIEMKLSEEREILVRGPNIFPGYWKCAEETARVIQNGWFHTGDQGEVNGRGNWRIVGRLKNLIILNSGHNVAPEPLEEALLENAPAASQAMVVGNNRSFLAALVTGDVTEKDVEHALLGINQGLPHYRQIRAFCILREPFSVENGLLTANGKLKRDGIAERFRDEIESVYSVKTS